MSFFRTYIHFIFVFVFLLSFYLLANIISGKEIFRIGIDLKGGSELIYKQNMENVYYEELSSIAEVIRKFLDTGKKKHLYDVNISIDNGIELHLYDSTLSLSDLLSYISDETNNTNAVTHYVVYKSHNEYHTFVLSEEYKNRLRKISYEKAIAVIRKRIDKKGSLESTIQRRGDNLVVTVPGDTSIDDIKNLLSRSGALGFYLIKNDGKVFYNEYGQRYSLENTPRITGDMLKDAHSGFDQSTGNPVVYFYLNMRGSSILHDITKNNINRPMVIVLDDVVISAPIIKDVINQGSVVISGSFTPRESAILSEVLLSGSLRAPLELLSTKNISASLGKDNVQRGFIAMIGSYIIICFLMAIYYPMRPFVVIMFSLFTTLVFLFCIFSLFHITITFTGFAGIVLTAGMSVDAMIIILERLNIRKRKCIDLKCYYLEYKKSLRGIFDANMTSIVICIFLYIFSMGTIRNFALSLGIGLSLSLLVIVCIFHPLFVLFGVKK